jgi:hypothetical protein
MMQHVGVDVLSRAGNDRVPAAAREARRPEVSVLRNPESTDEPRQPGGGFRSGAIARILAREFWTAGRVAHEQAPSCRSSHLPPQHTSRRRGMADEALVILDSHTLATVVMGALGVAGIVFFFVRLKRNQDEIAALIEARFADSTIVLRAPYAFLVAQQSRGYGQRQGCGPLVLTEDELFFAVPVFKTVFSIPLERVGPLEHTSRMLGHGILGTMLKIHYTDERGEPDALGLKLRDRERWEAEILRLQARAASRPPARLGTRLS